MLTKIITAAIAAALTCIPANGTTDIWISPGGNDSDGDGSRDKPYATIGKALEGQLGNSTDTLRVNVQNGRYYMGRLIDIRQGNSRPIIISGAEGMPEFIGGIPVRGWEKTDGGLYRAFIPEAFNGLVFRQFYINGRRATLARTPDKGFFNPVSVNETGALKTKWGDNQIGVFRVTCSSGDFEAVRDAAAMPETGPEVRFYHKWDNTFLRICGLDRDSCAFIAVGPGMRKWNRLKPGSRFFFCNYPQALDAPGEWYYDKTEGYVYYYPLPEEDMSTAECVIPVLEHWIRIKGSGQAHVSDICFRNLSFGYSSFVIPEGTRRPEQAAAYAPAAIELDCADNIRFENCEMSHTGSYAVWIKEECSGNVLSHCYISDLGAGGIKIGHPKYAAEGTYITNGNVVDNNIITGAGHELPNAVGIGIFQSSDNKVSHNDISDIGYTGISVGWEWGYSYSPAKRNIVEYNHIHHIGRGELSDMGGIYTLGISDGTRVNNNVIHDIVSYGYGGWGLYTDEGSTHIEMRNNLVHHCKCGAFHQHYGRENKIENNIFAFSNLYLLQLTRKEDHVSFSFARNIMLQDKGVTTDGPWSDANIDFGKNLFWSEGPELSINGIPNAMVADPMFVNPQSGDFRFRSLKTARRIGFVPFDYSKAGVYGSDEWKARATLPQSAIDDFNRKSAPRLELLGD